MLCVSLCPAPRGVLNITEVWGFPSKVLALQFEFAWPDPHGHCHCSFAGFGSCRQHPNVCRNVRDKVEHLELDPEGCTWGLKVVFNEWLAQIWADFLVSKKGSIALTLRFNYVLLIFRFFDLWDETTNQKHILGSSPEAGRGPLREVTMKPVRFCQMSRNGRQRPVLGWLSQLGCPGWMDGYMRSSIWHGWSCGQRKKLQLKWCVSYSFRPSDHNISQYITIIPVMNINRWSTCTVTTVGTAVTLRFGVMQNLQVLLEMLKTTPYSWGSQGSDWDSIGRTSRCPAEPSWGRLPLRLHFLDEGVSMPSLCWNMVM